MFDYIKETLGMIKECFGCGKFYKFHNFQWGMGPEVPVKQQGGLLVQETTFDGPGEWWMYCTKCGREAFDE